MNGLEVVNGDFSVNVDEVGRVFHFGSSFFDQAESINESGQTVIKYEHEISSIEALKSVAEYLQRNGGVNVGNLSEVTEEVVADNALSFAAGGLQGEQPVFVLKNVKFADYEEVQMVKKYCIVDKPVYSIRPCFDAVLSMANKENWFNVQIDATRGNIVQWVDWVHEAKYFVYPIGVNDPEDGQRVMVLNPEDEDASPLGWTNVGKAGKGKGEDRNGKFRETVGNNVEAQTNYYSKKNARPRGAGDLDSLEFKYDIDLKKEPEEYANASVVNLFYWNNIMHDVFYQYGFDEESGNFQEDNFGRGGREGDSVVANAQDGSGNNNANFATPPDGQRPRMRMYTWTLTRPKRDGDLESGIIIHEYGHGISIRLTGGPMNSGCLPYGESGGMGEGWGDWWATLLRMRPEYKSDIEFGMGDYSATQGIRPYPYSRSLKTNPHTYGYVKRGGYGGVHAKGAVWASILYEVYWTFVDALGFNPDWYVAKQKKIDRYVKLEGNIIILQLIVDGLKLQPCRPSFVDARNAIIKADEVGFQGEHVCLLWTAFAKRGLGYSAREGGNEAFDIPKECQ